MDAVLLLLLVEASTVVASVPAVKRVVDAAAAAAAVVVVVSETNADGSRGSENPAVVVHFLELVGRIFVDVELPAPDVGLHVPVHSCPVDAAGTLEFSVVPIVEIS